MKILEKISPLFLLLILCGILFWPVLFSTKLLPGFDPLLLFYPYSYQQLNQSSFWAGGIFSGFDTWALPAGWAGNWLYYFLTPASITSFFDFISFYHVIIFFYFILTLVFSYLAARMIGFDKWVSTIVASTFIFSTYNLGWMVNSGTAASLFIFPAIIYFLLKFGAKQNWVWPILGGCFLGFGLIMSHLQYALIAILGGFLFSLFLVFKDGFKFPRWTFLIAIFFIFSIGLALAAFELIPEYRLTQLTSRGQGLSFLQSQECALGVFDFFRYLIPNFSFGISCESLLYIGILPLIFAIIAIIYLRNDRRIIFWLLLLAFALLFLIKYSPLAWIFHQLPVWGSLRGPARFIMLGNFSLTILAGFGFNWILENKENFKESKIFRWIKRIFFGFLFLIISINVLGLFKKIFIKWADNYFDKYYYQKTIGLPLEHYHGVIDDLISGNFYTFSFLNKDFLIPFILTISAFSIIYFIHRFDKIKLFYCFLLIGFIWAVSSPMVSSGLTRDFFRETEIVKFLKNQNGIFRIYSLLPGLATYQLVATLQDSNQSDEDEFFKTMLPPNLNLVYDLDSIDGYESSIPRRTSRLLSELLSERATLGNRIAEARLKPEDKIKIFENKANILAMMNVKYIISTYPLDEKIFKKVFENKTTRFKIPIYIYENRNILPRFYVTNKVEFIDVDEIKSLKKILISSFDFKTTTLIECEESQDCSQATGRGKITNSEYKDGYLKLKAEFDAFGWMVFSESFSPFWQARINNEPTSIYRANYIYQAVKVPVGNNLIEFEYKPVFKK